MTDRRPIVDMFRYETTKRQVVGLQKDATTTLRLRGARPVTILELPAVDGYHPNSAVLLPESPAGNERSGLAAVGVVLQYARAHAAERLLVADHEPGDEALSRERAEVALALLLGLHEELAARCQARHDPRDVERLLAFVARNEGWDCDPAQRGRDGALASFRRRYEAERALGAGALGDGPVDTGDWVAFARMQDAALARFLAVDEAGLAALRARVRLVRGEGSSPGPGPLPPPTPPPPPPTPPREPDPIVEPGSTHPVVADLQKILNARGYPTPETGVHDVDSVDATRWFQTDFALTGAGVVDEATWLALRDPNLPAQPLPPAGLLKSGATGSRVRRLQAALNEAQAAGLTADGKFGPKTGGAVQTLQSREGLPVDTIVGPKTWTALLAKVAPPGPVPPHLLTQPVDPTPVPIAGTPPPDDVSMTQPATPLLSAVGCGESWPPARTRLRDYEPTTAARLDFLLFLEEDLPVLDCHTDVECDWKSCDLYRKAKYRGVVLEPPAPPPPAQGKPVLVLALAEPIAFQVLAGKAPAGPLFQPGAVGDSACLEGLAKLLRRGADASADRLAVAVHSRAAGDALCALRAENAAALLRGKAEWAAHSKKHATVADWQRLLTWVDATRQWGCDPGGVDNLAFGKTKTALDRFRSRFHKQHGVFLDTKPQAPTTKDWEAFHTLVVETLGQLLGGDAAAALAALVPVGAGHVACGARWATSAVEVHDYLGSEDDRVELLLFKAADAPADLEPTGDPVYRGRVFRAEHVDLGEAHRLLAQVVDEQGQPVNDVAFEVHDAKRLIRSGRTAADGLVDATVLQGTYRVKVLGALPEDKEKKPEPWEGGNDTLEELLAGDYQHRGSYFPDMTGFKSPHLQAWLVDACARAGCDPLEVTKIDESKGAAGDSEQGLSAGVPRWLTAFQTAAMTATQWGTQEQIYSRLMGAFFYSYFIERFYKPAGMAMPANVEYFLLHLGMSTGNGAATFDNIGAGTFAYCASASSRAYLKGLSLYGYGTKATGYAPGGPGVGHGLPVGFHSGRKPGAQFRPKPGDVMSVHTSIGPPDGHVLTVIWAETDGSKDGWMWQVSGNASHRSVCCSFSKLADDPNENTKPGFISSINCSYDHELQPHTLAAMTDAERAAKKCFKLEGTFPPPNAPGVIGHPTSAKPREALLVAGDVPTFPKSQPGAPTLLKIALQVLSFTGACAGSAPDARVLVAPGAPLRLEWEVQGYERLVLQPGERDVTLRTMEGEPFVVLSPLEHPPTDGRYTLEAFRGSSKGGSSKVAAQVEVRGIVDFRVFGRDPDASSKNVKKAELLQRTMKGGHPKYGTPFYSKVDSVGALPGAFQEIDYDSQDGQSWFWGQITPRSDARLVWKAIWPAGRKVLLTLNRRGKTPNAPEDVSGACREENGLLVGEHAYFTHGAYQTFFEADLQLTDDGGAPDASAMLRLRENYEMPGLKSFELSIDGRAVHDGDELDVAGKQVTVSWELTGSHSRNGLELLLLDVQSGARVIDSEVVRARPLDGEPTPAGHKEGTGSKRLSLTLPKGRVELRAVLELQNIKGRVAHKQVTFTIAGGGGGPDNGADVTKLPERVELHLFDDELRLVPGPYKLTMGSFVEEKTSSNGVVVFEVKKVPQAQRQTQFELEWGEKDALGHRYSKTMFLGFQQGTQEEQAKRRLHNLGYPISRAFEQNLRWFQDRTPGLTPSGRPDPATLAKLTGSHDGARIEMHEAPAPPTPKPPTV